ncbi:succinate dehydrogenase assembly factor 2 [Paracoccaceae bacterium Fryx2]|nr:succinate dehydrogenase assembly factor 2 [Paracoccaceae bacterium Fryx2]
MAETPEARLKRMGMRSWRRGTKEMDLILGPYSDAHLAGMDAARLALYEVLLAENDQDLLPWVLGQDAPPEALAGLIAEIGVFARARLTPAGGGSGDEHRKT